MRNRVEWVAVADGRRLRVLERPVPAAPLRELEAEAAGHAAPPSRALGADRPGRVRESVGGARHAVEPRQDPHEAAEAAFAREVAERLERAAEAGRYGRFVVAAPPAFLGRLRPALGAETRRRLAGTLDRDLTRLPVRDIAKRIEAAGSPNMG